MVRPRSRAAIDGCAQASAPGAEVLVQGQRHIRQGHRVVATPWRCFWCFFGDFLEFWRLFFFVLDFWNLCF